MEIIRGIVTTLYHRNKNSAAVESVQHCYELNKTFLNVSVNLDDRVLGTIVDGKFNICFDILLKNEQSVFGTFLSNNQDGWVKIKTVDGFNRQTYNPFITSYKNVNEMDILESDIVSVIL